ncbi:MAG TPA: PfkB family carbohydrate kinase [Longimicrobiales bacterium]|nr:PfkB family carbohydrate kinase [Longimicrobiales bacterium]
MSILVVGSVALDRIETPFGVAESTLGGAATYFAAAASLFHPVQLVGVIGDDFPEDRLEFLARRGVELDGLERAAGESFFWSGRYHYDLNTRDTLETRLGVFADFSPKIPPQFRDAEWVFLANIDPELQLQVLGQVSSPRLVACDTMNYWIEGKRDAILELLPRVNALLLNESEARELSGQYNLSQAARWIRGKGPRIVVIKKGEHGALLFTDDSIFFAPGFPLEEVFDPTGAGDAFAGGFMGWLGYVGTVNEDELRRAMIYGSATGSLVCEQFGMERLVGVDIEEVHERVRAFRRLTAFEHPVQAVHG